MPYTTDELIQQLDQANLRYLRFYHPAVFTCEEAQRLTPNLPGAETKNLFLRDNKGKRHFLVTLSTETHFPLKTLGEHLNVKGLTFASPERLMKYLGITPGAVSLLALINDTAGEVELVIDERLVATEQLLCHPLVNTETLSVPTRPLLDWIATHTRYSASILPAIAT